MVNADLIGQPGGARLLTTPSLIVDGEFDNNFRLSARNIAHIELLPTKGLNVYDIMRRKQLVLTQSAVKAIEERLA